MAERRHPYGYYLGPQRITHIQENLREGYNGIELHPNAYPNFDHLDERYQFNEALKSFRSQICEPCPIYRTKGDVSCSGLIPEQTEASVTFNTPQGREIFRESAKCHVVFQEEPSTPQPEE
jgi:hypothetical protein